MRHEQEAGTKWKRNGTHLPQAHEKHNTDFFIFLQLLMGGGEFCGIECWKVGNKFYVFGTVFFWNGCRKIILTFQPFSTSITKHFWYGMGSSKTPEMAKMFCGCCPLF